jgi:hypothetical protein
MQFRHCQSIAHFAAIALLLFSTSKVEAQTPTTSATPTGFHLLDNFDDPELKKIMPWTGTHKGTQALSDVFAAIQRFWKTLDFKVTDTIEQGSRVAIFGSFTYKSNVTGREITSPQPVGAFRRGKGGLCSVS